MAFLATDCNPYQISRQASITRFTIRSFLAPQSPACSTIRSPTGMSPPVHPDLPRVHDRLSLRDGNLHLSQAHLAPGEKSIPEEYQHRRRRCSSRIPSLLTPPLDASPSGWDGPRP